jgi:hypothetical protein
MSDNFTPADANQSTALPPEQSQTQAPPPKAPATTTMFVHAISLNIRELPSSSSKSIGKLLRGAKVEVVSVSKDGWALLAPVVGDKPGATRYVMAKAGKTDYLSAKKPAPLKPTVKAPPAPTAATPDQPPPAEQDTQPGLPVGLIAGGVAAVALLYFWMRGRK